MSKKIGEFREIPPFDSANSIRGHAELLRGTTRKISVWHGRQKVNRTNMMAGRRKGSMTVRATTGTRSSSMASGNLRYKVISCRLLYHRRYSLEEQAMPLGPLSEWYTAAYRGTGGYRSTRSRSNFLILASLCAIVSEARFYRCMRPHLLLINKARVIACSCKIWSAFRSLGKAEGIPV